MATIMKNGLRRFQFYLTEESYRKFEAEFLEFNKEREERREPKLSESGFCQMKLTGASPLLRGAPKGNKNARGRRIKSLPESSINGFSNASDDASSLPENQQSDTNDFAQKGTLENQAELSPALGISDDENTRSNDAPKSINSSAEVIADRVTFQDENSSEDLLGEKSDLSESERRAEMEDLATKIVKTGDEDLEFSDEEINGLVGKIGIRKSVGG